VGDRRATRNLERRQALKLGVLLAIGAAGGLVVRLGGVWTLARDGAGRTPLDRALAEARRLGKPVLVLVGPEPPEGLTQLGESFGELVELGGDDLLLDLLLCELACATPEQLFDAAGVKVVPDEVGLIESTASGLEWRPIDFLAHTHDFTPERWESALAANKTALKSALARDDEMLRRRANAVLSAQGPQVVAEFSARMDRGEPVKADELLSMSALLRVRADWPARVSALNDRAFSHFFKFPPRGSRWAGHACGAVEADALATDSAGVHYDLQRRAKCKSPALRFLPGRPLPNPLASLSPGVFCGMAFNGWRGGRFLLFYIDEP
jgi:hypothetical protein